MKETCIKNEIIYDGKIIKVEKDIVVLEDGHQSTREVVFNSGGVCVLAFDEQDQIILAKQFRYPFKEELIELPGGKQEKNETYVESGLRELREETGYTSEDAQYLGYFYPTVAYCSEVIHMVVAKKCQFQKQQLDIGEHVNVVKLSKQEMYERIANNEIRDGKTIVAFFKYEALQKKCINK